jgi:hypothetical protein
MTTTHSYNAEPQVDVIVMVNGGDSKSLRNVDSVIT